MSGYAITGQSQNCADIKRNGQIDEQLSLLRDDISFLEKDLTQLAQRLSPIVQKVPANPEKVMKEPNSLVPLADNLFKQRNRINLIRESVVYFLENIQL